MEENTQAIFIVISLLFVLIGLTLVSALLASADPYAFIATSNTEKLRNAMEQACGGQNQKISFSLPQNVPAMTSIFSFATSWLLYEGGDPHYTLYYEMFPAGDAIGWESFQKFRPKSLAYITEDAANKLGQRVSSSDDVDDYMKDVKKKLDDKEIATDIIILRNVILNSEFPHYRNYRIDRREKTGSSSDDFVSGFFGFGEWKRVDKNGKPLDGDNYFEFINYDALPTEEKTAIKYMPCGDHSLCLKTRSGVYRYELPNCEAQDIKYVALAYEERNVVKGLATGAELTAIALYPPARVRALAVSKFAYNLLSKIPWLGKTIIVAGAAYGTDSMTKYFVAAFAGYKSSDFSIASPCAAEEMEVTMMKCGDIPDEYSCNRMEKIPIMKFDKDDGILPENQYREYHYTCTEKYNENYDSTSSNPNIFSLESGEISNDQCLLVKVTKLPEGYCWTPDPYKELSLGGGIDNLFREPATQAVARGLGITPVREFTSYVYQNMEGVSPVTLLLPWVDNGFFIDRSGGLVSWGWPQHKGESILGDFLGLPGIFIN